MFATKYLLAKRTGPDRTNRFNFLKELIVEFTTTSSFESKRQTLANLANFSYDPVNYEYLKQLHAIDLFLAQLSEKQVDLLHFALAALCNLSPDPEYRDYMVGLNGIKLVSNLLLHQREEIALNAITTLYFLITPETKHLITPEIIKKIDIYESSTKPRYRNLGDKATTIKKVTSTDVEKFAEICGDTNPIHFKNNGNKPIVHGALLNSLVSSVIGTKLPGPGTVVISQTLNFPNKCYADENVRITVEVIECRKIVKVKFLCEVPDDGKVVLYGDARLVLNK